MMLGRLLLTLAVVCLLGACEAAPPPVAAAAPQPPEKPRVIMLFFAFDQATVSEEGLAVVREAAAIVKGKKAARVSCVGNSDTAGLGTYNMALSVRRAKAVKEALVRQGVPADAIEVSGRGEEALLVATPDSVREPKNRRVEIVVQ